MRSIADASTNSLMSMMRVDSSFTASSSSLSSRMYLFFDTSKPRTKPERSTGLPVSASTVCMRMRWLVLGLIRWKCTSALRSVAVNSATGQVTSESRRWPSQVGRAPPLRPFAIGLLLGIDQRLDGLAQRHRRLVIAAPRLGLLQQRRRRSKVEALGIEPGLHLAPFEGHRQRGAGPRARGERRDGRRSAVVAEIVEEDLTCALLLGHVEEEAVGLGIDQATAHFFSEHLGRIPIGALRVRGERHDDVQALTAGGLAERLEAELLQPLTQRQHAPHHLVERDVGRGIEIEYQAPRELRIAGLAVPGMQFGRADLRRRRQRLDAVELNVRLLLAAHLGVGDEVRAARHDMALEELLVAVDAVGRAHQRARSALD